MSGRETGAATTPPPPGLILRVTRAQAGDREALDSLLREHQAALYRHIRTITRDSETAFDALQDSLLLIARRLGGLRDPRWFKAWAYRIATREGVRVAKRESRFRNVADEEIPADPAPAFGDDAPFDAGLVRNCADRLDALPPACQIVLRLHYFEEMTFVEIAEALEIPVGTAKSRLAYGLARLRQAMVSG